jgi:GT2 family glycosyltransferase
VISVVVPHRDQPSHLYRCLAALEQQGHDAFEVIVVDDGSAPRSRVDVAGYPHARLILQTNGGPAAARNCGAREARGELLAFTDADCVPAPNWISSLSDYFNRHSKVELATGPVIDSTVPNRRNPLHRFFHAVSLPDAGPQRFTYNGHEMLGFIGANFAIRASSFAALGGFSHEYRLPGGEDFDLAFRAQISGHAAEFVDTARVNHRYPTAPHYLLRRWLAYGMGKARFAEAHDLTGEELHLIELSSWGDVLRFPRQLVRVTQAHFGHAFPADAVPATAYVAELCFQIGAAREGIGQTRKQRN